MGSTTSNRRKTTTTKKPTKRTKKTTKKTKKQTKKTQQAVQKLANKPTNWFVSDFQGAAKTEELRNFAHYCIPAAFGYTPEKYWSSDFEQESLHLRKDFMCSEADNGLFEEFMKAY